jgi:hypothetical protein
VLVARHLQPRSTTPLHGANRDRPRVLVNAASDHRDEHAAQRVDVVGLDEQARHLDVDDAPVEPRLERVERGADLLEQVQHQH